MVLPSTIHHFEIDLADADRRVYESLTLPRGAASVGIRGVPAHPRPRVALEYEPGIEFSRGLSDPNEPAISIRDATGALRAWIDVGSPDAARLHKASKAAPRVAVYMHKDPARYLHRVTGARIHRAETIAVWAVDRALLTELLESLDRRITFSLSVSERELFVAVGSKTITGVLTRHVLG